MRKKIMFGIIAMALLCGTTVMPVAAQIRQQEVTAAEIAASAVEEEEEDEDEEFDPEDLPDEEDGEDEETPGLTPAGNMTLVDDVTVSSGTKQFLTLTSRAGNFYYLIIDRDKEGNENVHFLNQIDERDLLSIMDEDEAKELEERITMKAEEEKAAIEAEKAAKEQAEKEVEPAPAPQPERYYTIAGYQISEKLILAVIGGVIVLMLIILALIILRFRKKPEENKPDPDVDYEDDYDDEILIPEEKMDDEE